jgi:ribonuclease Z
VWLGLCLVILSACDKIVDRLIDRRVAQNVQRADRSMLSSKDMTVVLCGTGGPLADPHRAGACTAIVAGGRVMLVDVGPGSVEQLILADLPPEAISAVFLTHFHSDHIGDLGEASVQSWIAGRKAPLDVYGPPGTTKVADGFSTAYAQDGDARTLHHSDAYMPRAAATP